MGGGTAVHMEFGQQVKVCLLSLLHAQMVSMLCTIFCYVIFSYTKKNLELRIRAHLDVLSYCVSGLCL